MKRLWVVLLLFVTSAWSGCTIEDISDELRVVTTVPAPSGVAPAAHRLSRSLGLGQDTDQVSRGEVTDVKLTVLSPDDADLFSLLRIDIFVEAGGERELLASADDFQAGETTRSPDVQYTSDIKPFLSASDFTIEWEVYYKTGGAFPAGGIELETVIGFNIDVEIL